MNIIGFIEKYNKDIEKIKIIIYNFIKKNNIEITDNLLLNEHLIRYIYNNSRGVIRDKKFNNYSGFIDKNDFYKMEYLGKFEEIHTYIKERYYKNDDFMAFSNNTCFAMVILQYTELKEPEIDLDEQYELEENYYNDYL